MVGCGGFVKAPHSEGDQSGDCESNLRRGGGVRGESYSMTGEPGLLSVNCVDGVMWFKCSGRMQLGVDSCEGVKLKFSWQFVLNARGVC